MRILVLMLLTLVSTALSVWAEPAPGAGSAGEPGGACAVETIAHLLDAAGGASPARLAEDFRDRLKSVLTRMKENPGGAGFREAVDAARENARRHLQAFSDEELSQYLDAWIRQTREQQGYLPGLAPGPESDAARAAELRLNLGAKQAEMRGYQVSRNLNGAIHGYAELADEIETFSQTPQMQKFIEQTSSNLFPAEAIDEWLRRAR